MCLSLSHGFKFEFEFEFLLKLRSILYFYRYFNKTIKLYNIYIFYYLKNVQIWLFMLKTSGTHAKNVWYAVLFT